MSKSETFFPPRTFCCRDDSRPKDSEVQALAEALLSDGEPTNTTPTARPNMWSALQQLTPEQLEFVNSPT